MKNLRLKGNIISVVVLGANVLNKQVSEPSGFSHGNGINQPGSPSAVGFGVARY